MPASKILGVVLLVVGIVDLALLAGDQEASQVPAGWGDSQELGRVGDGGAGRLPEGAYEIGLEGIDEV